MANALTQEELLKMKEAVDSASNSTIPFPIVKDNTVAVAGDPNKTELNKQDFTISFRIPDGQGGYISKDVEYKDVYLTPRRALTASRLITSLMPLFRNAKSDGTVGDYTEEEMIVLVNSLDENVIDLMYKLVASVIGVNDELVEFMIPRSVLDAILKILTVYPDLVNTGDAFFGF